jgi:hypothetical protein
MTNEELEAKIATLEAEITAVKEHAAFLEEKLRMLWPRGWPKWWKKEPGE